MRAYAIATLCLLSACGDNSKVAVSHDASSVPVPTLRVLFLGNSYTEVNNLPAVLASLGTSPGAVAHFEVGSRTPGGQTWEGHDADPEDTALIAQGWDYVVLQDQSEQPWLARGVKPALMSLDTKVKAAGAKTVLYMTWARAVDNDTVTYDTKFQQDLAVDRYYVQAGAAITARVAPVGRAWERALRDPTRVLHVEDHSHPNAQGTYLAACMMYATITGALPDGLNDGGLGIAGDQTVQLQKIADDTLAARMPPAAPLVGTWPLDGTAGNDMLVAHDLALGDTPPGATFSPEKYAATPYDPALDAQTFTVSISASRADWSTGVAAGMFEFLFSRADHFDVYEQGTELHASFTPSKDAAAVYVVGSLASLTPGWHRFTLEVSATAVSVAVDGASIASTPLVPAGATEIPAPPPERFTGIAIGVAPVPDDQSYWPAAARYAFTGALADLEMSR
ncbi:MAG TPA: DUF4886 domain-containing protein [Kofleriaceae bacterium]|jgi:hypothetical protein